MRPFTSWWPRRSPLSLRDLVSTRKRIIFITLTAITIVLLATAVWRQQALEADYRSARSHIDAARSLVPEQDSDESMQFENLQTIAWHLEQAEDRMRSVDRRLHPPLLPSIVRITPFVGKQYRSTEDFLTFSIESTALAQDAAQLAADVYAAYQVTGLSGPADPDAPTWLGVVRANRAQIDDMLVRFDTIVLMRSQLDEEHLPARGQRLLATADPLLDRASELRQEYASLLDYFDTLDIALGGTGTNDPAPLPNPDPTPVDEPDGETETPEPVVPAPADPSGRYIILLQNSNEIRQAGGFAGTYAVLTLRDGRLLDYEINSITELDSAYHAARDEPIPAPGPIALYLSQPEWFPRDVNWLVDFSDAARLLLQMYAETGRPPVSGVIAVDSSAVEGLLGVVGSLDVQIGDDELTVHEHDLIDTIESYRGRGGESHKDAVRIIGTALLERIRGQGLSGQKEIIDALTARADRGDIQFFSLDSRLQAEIENRGWGGRLRPDPDTPTIAMTIANIVGNKASQKIEISSSLELWGAGDAAVTHARWTIRFAHTGDPDGDRLYNGFHRTWVALYLPEGATITSSSMRPAPAELNANPGEFGFHVELLSGEHRAFIVHVTFAEPLDRIVIRRPTGVQNNILEVDVHDTGGCDVRTTVDVDQHYTISVAECGVTPLLPRQAQDQ
ncbi:MAG TPA: DUF4012 domain-containing protein [Thermomicrobiales bacterium]|nr:DUF4012 domain-containing protein [Thermomicrobiales bacterium]